MERLFEGIGGARLLSRGMRGFVDLGERENEYVMRADLPGVREQDVDIRIDDDNVLTVRGERREEETKQVGGYEYNERSYGSSSRSVALPAGIDASKIQADFRNGVLEVHVPKTESAQRARKIPIGKEEPRVMAAGNGPTAPQRS